MKKEFILYGLCCANCASKIEKEVSGLPGVVEASINMINSRLSISVKEDITVDLLGKVKHIVAVHEPSVKVKEIAEVTSVSHPNPDETDSKEDSPIPYIFRLGMALLITSVFSFMEVPEKIEFVAILTAYLLAGYDILLLAAKNITKGQIFDENFLMGIASLGAFIIGEQVEAVTVLVFYGIGELVQDMAVHHSRKNITALMDIRPDYANLKSGNSYTVVTPEQVKAGDIILVKPGERIPLDGIVKKGNSFIDTRALTGESVPAEVGEEDTVLSGTINTSGVLEILVTKPFAESTVSKILELVQNSGSKKAKSEKFITKFARYYTPIVVFTAVGVALLPPLFGAGSFETWIYRALSFLIISCPCALVISIPISFFGGIGGAARQGILIKGGNYLDALKNVETIVFDKTGTLTKGVFEVTKVSPAKGVRETDLIQFAMIAESNSTHPIAKSIQQYYQNNLHKYTGAQIVIPASNDKLELNEIIHTANIREMAGYGMIAELREGTIYAGNEKLIHQYQMKTEEPNLPGSVVHVAWNDQYLGYILISDEIKKEVKESMRELKLSGVKHTVMLTGDHKNTAAQVAGQCGVDEFYAELLPQDKVAIFDQYKAKISGNGKIVFVGDGINDAPVLAGADIGIAMGGIGSDAAIEAADVVIMKDDIKKIVTAIKIAKKTRHIVLQNIVFALGVKVLIMILAFLGITSIWFAIFADVGVALIALINAMRAMRTK